MPAPYTMDAVKALRHAAATQTSVAEIQRLLGWDSPMLARVCHRHGIELVVTAPMPVPSAAPREPAGPFAPYPPEVMHSITGLGPLQAQIFRVLQRHTGQLVTGSLISDFLGRETGTRSLAVSIAGLARRLERMRAGYRIESQKGPKGGYRLVLCEAAP